MISSLSKSERKKITNTYKSGKFSTTLVISVDAARKYKIDQSSNVLIKEAENGILKA
jgi:hypothetical protein